jgi:CxxC-x17-CxxC domain-containing protein
MSGDLTLTCRDCGQGFTFTAGEQDFYASRGFTEPTRCGDCRAARRTERDRGSYSGGGSGGGSYESSAPRGPRQMYEAVCTGCGSIAQVPFQPSAEKPVYCSTCFEQRRGTNTGRPGGGGGRFAGRGRF